MGNHKRDFLVIISQILDSLVSGPLRKTHISHKAKLDSKLTNQYLSLMKSSALINQKDESVFFEIAPNGIKFLTTFQKIGELLEIKSNHPKEKIYDLEETSLGNYQKVIVK